MSIADGSSMEIAIFYYAFASWRSTPTIPSGTRAFAYHRKNGYAGILYALVGVTLVEMIAVDFLIRTKTTTGANVLLAVDLFAALWLFGFARSVKLRPILVGPDRIVLRNGIIWSLDVARDNIARAVFGRGHAPAKATPGYMRLVLGSPNVLLELKTPVRARGPYGMTKTVSRVGLFVDDLAGFESTMSSAVSTVNVPTR